MSNYSFQEVEEALTRMCKAQSEKSTYTCYVCPLGHTGYCDCAIDKRTKECIAKAEEVIMTWAAEHPEPVYETWLEFIKRFETGGRKSDDDFIYWMGTTSIPDDIAKKLGIEPKEG